MKPLDIKFKIAACIALLLLVGMVLLDMVMVFAAQRLLLNSAREKGGLLVELVGKHALFSPETAAPGSVPAEGARDGTELTLPASNVAGALWIAAGGGIHWILGPEGESAAALMRTARTAMDQRAMQTDTVGTTWGIFWRQNKYLVLAGPFYDDNRFAGVAGVSMSLGSIFLQLRSAQKFIWYYLLINTVLLSLIGLYRVHQLAIRPILKITGRAEAFRPGDTPFSLEESGENELARLSRAINRVFDLNREDREKLKQTVTRLEDAMARLKQAQQEIIRAEKLATVGRLSSGVAHEIGNPIGIVMGYLGLIKQGVEENDELSDYIRRAEVEVQRIRAIIRQLLDYSRPSEAGRKPVSLHGILEDVIAMARVQPLFADLTVTAELAAEFDLVSGDPDQLRQLFLNFILNAADAVKLRGKEIQGQIRITSENTRAEAPDGKGALQMLRIQFEDNGSGISEGDLNRIFDPFYTTKPTGMGSGLGLWVSLLIAEAMGGTIEAHSKEGEGARMVLVLPVEGEGQ